MGEQRTLFLRNRNIRRALQPLHEARHRRQRDEILQPRQFALQFLGHLLDQEAAEGNAGEAALGVGDRIEHRGAGAVDRNRLAVLGEQRRDRAGNRFRQRHLDEDQGFVDQGGMKEGVAAPVHRIDAAAQIVPVADLMHRFIADDLFQNIRGRRPVDPAQHEKAPVEPGGQQMRDVAVEPGKALVGGFLRQADRRATPPARWCAFGARLSRRNSSCRRGSEAKCRSLASSSLGCARQVSMACASFSRSGP